MDATPAASTTITKKVNGLVVVALLLAYEEIISRPVHSSFAIT